MRRSLSISIAIALSATAVPTAQVAGRSRKIDIVSVTGCLREQGANNWMVVGATDPLVSNANAPLKSEIPTSIPEGKNQFKLIGVGEFNLPAYRNQTVLVKGLHIKAQPVDRLNITSVTTVATSCAASAPK